LKRGRLTKAHGTFKRSSYHNLYWFGYFFLQSSAPCAANTEAWKARLYSTPRNLRLRQPRHSSDYNSSQMSSDEFLIKLYIHGSNVSKVHLASAALTGTLDEFM
jgi:hypothetical protein